MTPQETDMELVTEIRSHCHTPGECDCWLCVLLRKAADRIESHCPDRYAEGYAAAREAAARWHGEQAAAVWAEHPGIQGSKSQKRRARLHVESATAIRAIRSIPTPVAGGLSDQDRAAIKHARSRIAACKIAMPSGPASQAAMIREIEAALDAFDRLTPGTGEK